MKSIIEDLNWRYATKKFDPEKKLTDDEVNTLIEVLRLSPTSYGLQPLKFLLIKNNEIRTELQKYSWNQQQITEASHLFVLCAFTAIQEDHIERYKEVTIETRNAEQEKVDSFGKYIQNNISKLTPAELATWTSKQAYIALGHMLHACAQMRIDATPMEGFEPEGYDKVLGLSEKKLKAVLVVPVGHRHKEDKNQFQKKVRLNTADLFEFID